MTWFLFLITFDKTIEATTQTKEKKVIPEMNEESETKHVKHVEAKHGKQILLGGGQKSDKIEEEVA